MAIDFPNSPTTNQTFTVGLKTWKYDGEKWVINDALSTNFDGGVAASVYGGLVTLDGGNS